MPNRMIREDLLDSERYWSVTIEARQLFWHLMLLADDFGCITFAPVFIRRRCFDEMPSQSKLTKLIEQLVDADLIRSYKVGNGIYGFIPRFRQKLRIDKPKYPPPPESLYADDQHAVNKFQTIKGEATKMQGRCSANDGQPSSEVKRSEEEKKGREVPSVLPVKSYVDWAAELGIEKLPGEGVGAFQIRVAAAVKIHKSAQINELDV